MNTELMKQENNIFYSIEEMVKEAFKKVAPSWPLKNLIAVNPLQGLEDLPFEQAVIEAEVLYQQEELPKEMHAVNRETIKWCQAFFDQGQATIPMPLREEGLYMAWRQLACWDDCLHKGNPSNKQWLNELPPLPSDAIAVCLRKLNISQPDASLFLSLLLTTLPGWAAYIKYLSECDQKENGNLTFAIDYLAIRLIITSTLWPQAFKLLSWYEKGKKKALNKSTIVREMIEKEDIYRSSLFKKLGNQTLPQQSSSPLAQIIFCIDVRSEPFRRALELQGPYETFGFAGFFGIPLKVNNSIKQEIYSSCPVLLEPEHCVKVTPSASILKRHQSLGGAKRLYQSLKYTFITPFTLVEFLGPFAGIWMGMRSLFPKIAYYIKKKIYRQELYCQDDFSVKDSIPLSEQCAYAEGMLNLIGLTKNFASLIVLCGHGSTTVNNAYASALDCGACGGRHGDINAIVLASILNCSKVRNKLQEKNIFIPNTTHFIAAKHNTTTDEVTFLYYDKNQEIVLDKLRELKKDLEKARKINSDRRSAIMDGIGKKKSTKNFTKRRSFDWAEVRPEWGLARNATFIVGPRSLTKELDLEGRAFLHSYDWQQDFNGSLLKTILTAPMVVAQWINGQYLFSTIDNVAYGAGSKVTHNITGKLGIMQGNASDLMHGLPLQSVYSNDYESYHEPLRLLTIVYAPKDLVNRIIETSETLKKLFGNGWVYLACIEPNNNIYMLKRDFTWDLNP